MVNPPTCECLDMAPKEVGGHFAVGLPMNGLDLVQSIHTWIIVLHPHPPSLPDCYMTLSLSLSPGILPVFSKENEGWQEAGLLPNPNNQTDTHLTLSLALSLSSQILERERGYTLLNNQLNNIGYFFLTFFSLPLN